MTILLVTALFPVCNRIVIPRFLLNSSCRMPLRDNSSFFNLSPLNCLPWTFGSWAPSYQRHYCVYWSEKWLCSRHWLATSCVPSHQDITMHPEAECLQIKTLRSLLTREIGYKLRSQHIWKLSAFILRHYWSKKWVTYCKSWCIWKLSAFISRHCCVYWSEK